MGIHIKIRYLIFLFWIMVLHSALLSVSVKGHSDRNIPIDNLTPKDINKTVELAIHFLDKLKTLETNIQSHCKLEQDTPNYGEYISFYPEKDARERGRAGWIAARSTQMMIAWHCSRYNIEHLEECEKKTRLYNLSHTQIADSCKKVTASPCSLEEYRSPYRSITGLCNHHNSHEGESFTAYKRILQAVYKDGVENVRRSVNRLPLPNARDISAKFTRFTEANHDSNTVAVLQWSQFIEQDLSRVAVSPMYHYDTLLTCCGEDGFVLSPRYVHRFCLPISVTNDPFYGEALKHCMSYVRSLVAMKPDCSFGPNEQLNQATHFLDASQLYGSSYDKSRMLRDSNNGQIKMTNISGKHYLPLSSRPTEDCLNTTNKSLCFMSGDPRVNFEPQMTVMHTLWAREHNRIARKLSALGNTHWTADDIFEEARRIVIAEIQHITYNEWIEKVLGKKQLADINKFSAFQESVDPNVLNSVGTAVFRAFQSLYPDNIKLLSEDRKETATIKLQNHYYKPDILRRYEVFDDLLRGMTTQVGGKIDMHFPEDLINKLFIMNDFGYDMLALDIQRGRDHGLPPYNDFRKYIGYRDATKFSDYEELISRDDVEKLSQIYTNPYDVDLIIGGILEQPKEDSLFGPTFSWLLSNQLIRTRSGDRYFYTNRHQPKPFTSEQLQEIKKVTLARIICDNSDIKQMQPNVFEKISKSNPLVRCDSTVISSVNLAAWLENKEHYFMI